MQIPFPMLISAQELLNTLNTNEHSLKIFDCRFDLNQPHAGEQAFLQGHIPNAYYIHLEKDLAGPKNRLLGRHPLPTPQAWQATCESLVLKKETHIIIYDDLDNSFSSRLWWMLHATGYDRVQLLDGGLTAWLKIQGRLESGPSLVRPAIQRKALPGIPFNQLVQITQIKENLLSSRHTILDARAKERYQGDIEPLDPVAGHIPGALNRPYKLNLTPTGQFKTQEVLRDEFLALGISPRELIHQCGSGVTACHNLFAMEYAGLKGSQLYAGSWSEWCQYPDNPVALGPE